MQSPARARAALEGGHAFLEHVDRGIHDAGVDVPYFVVGLFAMAALRTLGLLPEITFRTTESVVVGSGEYTVSLVKLASHASYYCILLSMAAVGLGTNLKVFRRAGRTPLVAGALAGLLVASTTFFLVGMLSS